MCLRACVRGHSNESQRRQLARARRATSEGATRGGKGKANASPRRRSWQNLVVRARAQGVGAHAEGSTCQATVQGTTRTRTRRVHVQPNSSGNGLCRLGRRPLTDDCECAGLQALQVWSRPVHAVCRPGRCGPSATREPSTARSAR